MRLGCLGDNRRRRSPRCSSLCRRRAALPLATGAASLNPTAGIAGLLYKPSIKPIILGSKSPPRSVGRGCNRAWSTFRPMTQSSCSSFWEQVPDQARAEEACEAVGHRIMDDVVALDPSATGYAKSPLAFAPHPIASVDACSKTRQSKIIWMSSPPDSRSTGAGLLRGSLRASPP